MLSNAYFLVNIGFDTAENEPAKNVQKLRNANGINFDKRCQILRTCCSSCSLPPEVQAELGEASQAQDRDLAEGRARLAAAAEARRRGSGASSG